MNSTEYGLFVRPHTRALKQLLLEVDFFIADSGRLNVFSIDGRVKSYESAIEKQRRLEIPIQELQDLAAFRVVLATSDEVEVLAQFFHDAGARSRLKVKNDDALVKQDGYRSRHLILEVGPQTTHSIHDVTVEVQLPTILQHAYNFISHAWVYKSVHNFPPGWRRRFRQLARDLANLDVAVAGLHDEVLRLAASGGDGEPLTPFAFQQLSKEIFGESVPLSEAVWYTRFLSNIQCTTVGQTRAFFLRRDVLEFRESCRAVRSEKNQSFVDYFLGMPLYRFYTSVGVRLNAERQFFESLLSEGIGAKDD